MVVTTSAGRFVADSAHTTVGSCTLNTEVQGAASGEHVSGVFRSALELDSDSNTSLDIEDGLFDFVLP
jgi:hypothetical protein